MANNILRLKQLPDIVESGSNANGSYIKYRDGTMECWGSQAVSAYPQAIIFPQSFAATDYMFTPAWEKSGQAQRTCNANPDARTISGISVWVRNDGSNLDETSGTIRWRAVGKWSSVSTTTGPVVSIGRGIIESGASSTGNYIKYEDGTMIQWGSIGGISKSSNSPNWFNATGGATYFAYTTLTLPQAFANSTYSITGNGNASQPTYITFDSKTTTNCRVLLIGGSIANADGCDWIAYGRWQSATNLAGAYTYGQGIIETGTNSNGTYIKFDNGTLIMYGQITSPTTGSSIARTFPYAAVGISGYQSADCGMSCSATAVSGSVNMGNVWASTNTSFYYYITTNNYINWHFVGRWK